ncbi:FG-GAP-like repeat-containing protein [Ekhidna sp. To15]|uniref:FG-GAP-like repeat-containing protein n=1 Tax=Ekhidna sp. To15 TaxID=3395267 RepID=UPI003F526CB6
MMRKIFTILLFIPIVLVAQKPFVNNITPTNVEFGETVTISGSNLSGTPRVFFGGVEASGVNVISDNLIEVTVPAGATQSSIIVLNNGLVTQSSQHFFISFGGSDISNYDAEYDDISTTEQAASDICMCDLNGDDKNDIVIVHAVLSNNDSQNEVTIFLNNTTGTGAFTGPTDFQLDQTLNNSINESGFNSVACGDIDNDGDNDLAFTSNLSTNPRDVYVYSNDGSATFSEEDDTSLFLPTTSGGDQRTPRSIHIADMDRDGIADLVVGNLSDDNTFHIFKNTGSFAFDNAVEIAGTATGESTGILDVADFNNDEYLDVVTLTFRESNTGIYFFKNTSSIDNFNFELQETVTNGGQNTDIAIGDFDSDGLNDIVATSRNTGLISVFENQSTTGQINFGTSNNVTTTGSAASGVTLADLNGDGKLDIASSNATGDIYIFENTGSGSISFGNEQVLSTNSTTLFIASGDLNGDAKPDLAYTQSVQTSEVGNLAIILNRNCVVPQLSPTPGGGGVFCSNPETFTLTATASPGATYDWTVTGNTNLIGGASFSTGTTNSATFQLSTNATTTIQVTINQDGTCAAQTDTEVYTIAGSVTASPAITPLGGVQCAGDDVTLSTTTTFENYFWTLPDGSTQTSATVVLNSISTSDAGTYTLRVQNSGSCSSSEVSIDVEVSQPPLLEIINNNLDNFCAGTNVSLEVPDFTSDFTYEWQLNGTDFGTGSDQASISTNQGGDYTVEVTDVNTCLTETATYTINSIALPNSVADGPTETCVDFLTSFTSASTGQGSFTLEYEWVVEDVDNGNAVIHTATTQDLDFTFTTAGNYNVILNTNYDPSEVYAGPLGTDICVGTTQIAVTASDPPTSLTFNEADGVQKCQADVISIGVTGSGISSYSWSLRNAEASNDTIISSNVSTSDNINLSIPIGIDSVYAIADVVTGVNCIVRDSILVRNFPSNVDIELSDFSTPDIITLEEENFVNLNALNLDISTVRWRPNDIMSDSTAQTVTVNPNQPSTIITLLGVDASGCNVSTQVEIVLDNIRPKRTFSPNGDLMNDCWEILNTLPTNIADPANDPVAGCKVYIFDSKGRNIKVADAPFDNNCVWDGNSNGSPVPEGIYYFVFKCPDDQMSKSGSILLAR